MKHGRLGNQKNGNLEIIVNKVLGKKFWVRNG
jgi:hypothetical protein